MNKATVAKLYFKMKEIGTALVSIVILILTLGYIVALLGWFVYAFIEAPLVMIGFLVGILVFFGTALLVRHGFRKFEHWATKIVNSKEDNNASNRTD